MKTDPSTAGHLSGWEARVRRPQRAVVTINV